MDNFVIIKNGVTLSLVYILLTLILFIVGIDMEQWAKWLVLAITFVCIVFSIKLYADTLDDKDATFGQLFKVGFFSSLLFVIIVCLFMVLYVKVIDVDFYEKINDLAREEMKAQNISEDKMESFIEAGKKYMTVPFLLLSTFLSNLITCNIGNLIGALYFRKNKD
ncbi:MAG: DUF4199 domain-containing protein [Sphingobacteriales bacterium]|jgi:hypothetical protein|nr:MAG: DUF4199 domain-containing protein [Sphingobacteriales bacterium]